MARNNLAKDNKRADEAFKKATEEARVAWDQYAADYDIINEKLRVAERRAWDRYARVLLEIKRGATNVP